MFNKVLLLRGSLVIAFTSTTLFLGACSRPGTSPTSTATASPTVPTAATPTRSIAPSVAPSVPPAPSAAPVTSSAPSAAPVSSAAPASRPGQKYVVQPGDTLSGIAEQFGVTMQQLIDANSLQNPDLLLPGQELIIPGN